ncbi:hypothetical protein CHX27_13860 [Flavobacterium aurantiibacter]|uniref:Uncharacterized protein n=1 Tax=Flavobacterium aurantiibacter TaxID=2023067 RepID=A0A255ZE09_9FLAO|nr:hypothetical protein CHX27_13860 [Flavobacterium aurantiibacter]
MYILIEIKFLQSLQRYNFAYQIAFKRVELLFLIVALGKLKLFWFLALDLCGWKKQMCLNVRWRSGVACNVMRIKNRFNVFYTLLALVALRGIYKRKLKYGNITLNTKKEMV